MDFLMSYFPILVFITTVLTFSLGLGLFIVFGYPMVSGEDEEQAL